MKGLMVELREAEHLPRAASVKTHCLPPRVTNGESGDEIHRLESLGLHNISSALYVQSKSQILVSIQKQEKSYSITVLRPLSNIGITL